jgi:alpha-tubulin suppressor-like RCC1 family protein
MRAKLLLTAALVLVALAAPSPAEARAGQPLTGVTSVTTGLDHSCAVLTTRQVRCWGRHAGQLGTGGTSSVPQAPVPVSNVAGTGLLGGVVGIAAGFGHTCAVLVNRQVRCWGAGSSGQLGDGDGDDELLPVVVLNASGTAPLSGVVQVTAAANTSCARLVDGQVRCWGADTYGQLGDGAPAANKALPVPVRAVNGTGNLRDVTQVDAGESFGCARLSTGQVRCWGDNFFGQLGNDSESASLRPVVVVNGSGTGRLTGVRRVSAGSRHTCAVRTDGTARCWGDNEDGRLGNGTESAPRFRPVGVVNRSGSLLAGITALDAAETHSCARLTSGQVRCWGANEGGQLGVGVMSVTPRLRPAVVRNGGNTDVLRGVTQLHASALHTCARLTNGQVRCWGYNTHRTLGNGNDDPSPLPVRVTIVTS